MLNQAMQYHEDYIGAKRFFADNPLACDLVWLYAIQNIEGAPLVKNLAEYMGVTPSAASQRLNQLHDKNLVQFIKIEGDKRMKALGLTLNGRAFYKEHTGDNK